MQKMLRNIVSILLCLFILNQECQSYSLFEYFFGEENSQENTSEISDGFGAQTENTIRKLG